MNIILEDKIEVIAPLGTTRARNKVTLEPGKIIGVKCFNQHGKLAEFVRVQIKDNSGFELSKLTALENFRDRDVEYSKSFKPLATDGGRPIEINIESDIPFIKTTIFDFVFVYEQTTASAYCPQ